MGLMLAPGTPAPSTIPSPHSVRTNPAASATQATLPQDPEESNMGPLCARLGASPPSVLFLGVSAPLFGARHPNLLTGESPGVPQASPQVPGGCQPQAPAHLWGPPRLNPHLPSSTVRF